MTDTKRVAESRIVYPCQHANFYDDDPGECPDSGMGDHPVHRLQKRRMLICSECTQSYKTQKDFAKHECGDAL